MNEYIFADRLRVISDVGEQLGILSKSDALYEARRKGLDLVVISEKADPPVAKILDYGKYKYQKQKKEKESKKHQKIIQIKEIRLSVFIDKHDLEVKRKRAIKFLEAGDTVKITLRFRGREQGLKEQGRKNMENFIENLSGYGKVGKDIKLDGRVLSTSLVPIKK
ncbi:MAG: translation initiation factor IF-3 [Clostridiales Family XIII bacterium]|nr:translation initiation factor IF-3 [Clostridiales Family XIII bacterium]